MAATSNSTTPLLELSTEPGVLRYYDVGPKSAPPLLLLHGSGPGVTGWRNFKENLPVLSRQFRCLVLEMPGFGVSDTTDRHPLAAAVPAVHRFLDGLDLMRVSVIGNSLGGVVGARLAMESPDRVERLVTIGGVGPNLLSPGPGEGINLLMEFAEEPSRERLRRWISSMVYDQQLVTDALVEARWSHATEPATLEVMRRQYSRAALLPSFRPSSDAPTPYWANLHKIQAETLLTWGRDDRVSPLDMALLPMRTIPRAELHVFPRCGHWVMIEQKDAWESAVLAFLTRASPDES